MIDSRPQEGAAGGAALLDGPRLGVPVAPQRPRNTLWIIGGVLLVMVSGLAALSITRSLSNRVEVLVATGPIAKGEVITGDDLGVASISVSSGIRAVSPAEKDELIGMVATGPIGGGSIVHRAQFVDGEAEDARQVIVGFELEPGQYPRIDLLPGSEVLVVEVAEDRARDEEGSTAKEITTGEIVDVRELGRSDSLLVSVRIGESISVSVADLASRDLIRLVLVDAGFPDDVVEPLQPADPVTPVDPGATDDGATDGSDAGEEGDDGTGADEGDEQP